MSDIGDAIGTAVEGGLFARVFGGKRGALVDKDGHPIERGHFAEGECLNCGSELQGAHCHVCGQKAHLHRTIRAFLQDLLHGALHLDGKTWRTLPLLVRKPGELTRRYIEGERARFVSPMAMFLFSVFLMFAVFQAVGLTAPSDIEGDTRALVAEMIENEADGVTAKIAEIDEELAQTDLDDARRVALEAERTTLERDLELLKNRGQNLNRFLVTGETDFLDNLETEGGIRIAEAKERLDAMPEGSPEHADLAAEIAAAERGLAELKELEDQAEAAIPFVDSSDGKFTFEPSGVAVIDSFVDKWRSNPSLMLYKLQANGYKFSWLLIPLSIPFVWLLFAWKRRFKAYDHAIFVTYSLAFMSLLFITLSILGTAGVLGGWVFFLLTIIPPIHLYKHLRGAYGLSRFSAIWRLVLLIAFILVVLVLFLQILVVMGGF